MLWLDNVALAGDNASASQLNPSLLNTHLNDNGHVFYHGAMLVGDEGLCSPRGRAFKIG